MHRSVLFFLVLGTLFALTHIFATMTSLYWFYPWFDTVMHFWGGLLIVLSVRALSRLGVPFTPNKKTIFGIGILLIILWEVFEQLIGLSAGDVYLLDTFKDIIIGLAGVTIGYLLLRNK